MSKCNYTRNVGKYLDGHLGKRKVNNFRNHLKDGCENCRVVIRFWEKLKKMVNKQGEFSMFLTDEIQWKIVRKYAFRCVIAREPAMKQNEWIGWYVKIISGKGVGQVRMICSNLSDMIFVTSNWTVVPDEDSISQIIDPRPKFEPLRLKWAKITGVLRMNPNGKMERI